MEKIPGSKRLTSAVPTGLAASAINAPKAAQPQKLALEDGTGTIDTLCNLSPLPKGRQFDGTKSAQIRFPPYQGGNEGGILLPYSRHQDFPLLAQSLHYQPKHQRITPNSLGKGEGGLFVELTKRGLYLTVILVLKGV